jgi:hypothetical protein
VLLREQLMVDLGVAVVAVPYLIEGVARPPFPG